MNARTLLAAAATTAVTAAALVSLAANPAAADNTTVRVIQSNIAGGLACPLQDPCLTTVETQVARFAPNIVTGEEFCAEHRDQFAADHPDWDVAFTPLTLAHPRCGGTPKGQILAAPQLDRVAVYDLPGDFAAKNFTLLCGDTSGEVRVCVAHLRSGSTDVDADARLDQARAIIAASSGWRRTIVGCDCNFGSSTAPARLLRQSGYTEADPVSGAPTRGAARLDHIWYHRRDDRAIPGLSIGVVAQPSSDHQLVRGRTTW